MLPFKRLRRRAPLRLALPFALACIFALRAPLAAYESDPETVDQSVAIQIGDYAASQYLVDKNYNFYLAQRRDRPPSDEERAAWFRSFLARQGLVADLRSQGYAEKPEVRRVVSQMERYILTQEGGPLYEKLLAGGASPEQIAEEIPESTTELEGALLRFETAEQALALLGADFDSLSSAEKSSRIAAAPIDADCIRHVGHTAWPFHPFHEIRRELARANPGDASSLIEGKLGVYAFAVNSAKRQRSPHDARRADGIAKYVVQLDRSILTESRARQILEARAFAVEEDALEKLASQLANSPEGHHTIDPFLVASLGDAPLCRYTGSDGEARAVLAADFAAHFNQLMIRSLPRNRADLARALSGLVVAEEDLAEARRLGCDRDPRFLEDRMNFENNQIVDCYEREVLAPQLELPDEEVRAYYDARPTQYSEVTAIDATLLLFESVEQAAPHAGPGHADAAPAPASRSVTVAKDGPAPAFPFPPQMLFGMPLGQRIGPFPFEGKQAVLVKQANSEVAAIPFETAAIAIRQTLLRERLDARLAELPLPGGLIDKIVYQDYGLPGKPYASRQTEPAAAPDRS